MAGSPARAHRVESTQVCQCAYKMRGCLLENSIAPPHCTSYQFIQWISSLLSSPPTLPSATPRPLLPSIPIMAEEAVAPAALSPRQVFLRLSQDIRTGLNLMITGEFTFGNVSDSRAFFSNSCIQTRNPLSPHSVPFRISFNSCCRLGAVNNTLCCILFFVRLSAACIIA